MYPMQAYFFYSLQYCEALERKFYNLVLDIKDKLYQQFLLAVIILNLIGIKSYYLEHNLNLHISWLS